MLYLKRKTVFKGCLLLKKMEKKCGRLDYLKVSMEIILVQMPIKENVSDGKFDKPIMLLTNYRTAVLDTTMQDD